MNQTLFDSPPHALPTALPDPHLHPEYYDSVAGKRLAAWAVDAVLVGVGTVLVLVFTVFVGLLFLPLVVLSVSFLYRWVTIAGGSATLGMRLMAIELRGPDGHRLDTQGAFLHTLGYTLSCAVPVLQLLSMGLMATTARGQGLTDHVLGTAALNRRIGG